MSGDNWDVRTLSLITLGAGALITVAAITWWAMFYSEVINPLVGPGKNLASVVHCLWSSPSDCTFLSSLYGLTGGTPYDPSIFWIGISGIVIGLVLYLTASKE